jgi:hypothetical protein
MSLAGRREPPRRGRSEDRCISDRRRSGSQTANRGVGLRAAVPDPPGAQRFVGAGSSVEQREVVAASPDELAALGRVQTIGAVWCPGIWPGRAPGWQFGLPLSRHASDVLGKANLDHSLLFSACSQDPPTAHRVSYPFLLNHEPPPQLRLKKAVRVDRPAALNSIGSTSHSDTVFRGQHQCGDPEPDSDAKVETADDI